MYVIIKMLVIYFFADIIYAPMQNKCLSKIDCLTQTSEIESERYLILKSTAQVLTRREQVDGYHAP